MTRSLFRFIRFKRARTLIVILKNGNRSTGCLISVAADYEVPLIAKAFRLLRRIRGWGCDWRSVFRQVSRAFRARSPCRNRLSRIDRCSGSPCQQGL